MGANWVFLVFRRGGNVLFRVFRSSAVAETLLFLFFFFRPWPKACFSGFLLFGRGRKAKMGYFCFSKGVEMQKMGDFAFPRGWKRRKWGVFAFPRGWKRGFFRFPIKNCDFFAPNGCGCPEIAIFLLPTAVFVQKLRFFGFRGLWL